MNRAGWITGSPAPAGAAACIGPNAVIQLAAALAERLDGASVRRLFEAAGHSAWLLWPPERMLPEAEVAHLHRSVRAALEPSLHLEVARNAGHRTAQYLLSHRIPRPAQAVLRGLPARWAAPLLLRAVARHAWTFAGSGVFAARCHARGATLTVTGNPLCRGLRSAEPACHYVAATFERLMRVLVHPAAQVVETACEARGDGACRFEVSWGPGVSELPESPRNP